MASCTPVKLAFSYVEPEGGASDKAPIIFCHGLSGSKEQWDVEGIPKLVADATKRKVYAIDARNHGDTEWTDEFNLESNEVDLLHFMDTIGAKTAVIVGASMGGVTAMRTALMAPERVEGIFVEDMATKQLPPEMYGMINMFAGLSTTVLDQLPLGTDIDEAREIIFDTLLKCVPPEMQGEVLRKESMNLRAIQLKRVEDGRLTFKSNMKVIAAALQNADRLIPEYKGLYEGPACFIYGTVSPFNVGDDEANIKKLFPNAKLVPIKNATHNVHGDCREEFMETFLKFLSK